MSGCADPWVCDCHSGRDAERAWLSRLLADMAWINGAVTEAEVASAIRTRRIAEMGAES